MTDEDTASPARAEPFEETLARREAELEAAHRDFEALAHSVSHDLRAPVRAIDGFLRLLVRSQQGKLDEAGEEQLQLLGEAVGRLREQFEGLVDFTRIGKEPLRRRPVSIEEIVRGVVHERSAEIESRSIALEVQSLPAAVGDPVLLRRAILCLFDNALKFSRPATRARITFGTLPESPPVYFVRDNGVGFDTRDRARLFGLFQRLHAPEAFEGNGIGLAVAASIVRRHGGRIWADSKPGETSFYWTL